jgi:Protein of unknown function (DUF2997)
MQYLITIKNGKVTITVQGMAGAGCQGKSVEFAQLLSGKVETTEHTEEYYAEVVTSSQMTVRDR